MNFKNQDQEIEHLHSLLIDINKKLQNKDEEIEILKNKLSVANYLSQIICRKLGCRK